MLKEDEDELEKHFELDSKALLAMILCRHRPRSLRALVALSLKRTTFLNAAAHLIIQRRPLLNVTLHETSLAA